ncbi:MAG: DnaD domain protein [Solobacterium sp.]|nr:DnaD domain protein [Solobacterium sp.]
MAVKGKDTYRCECSFSVSEDMIISLMSLYQPLIGGDGVLVYMTLLSESRNYRSLDTHGRLLTMMNMSPDVFDSACARLEEYRLLKTYMKEQESRSSYIYILYSPMNIRDFSRSNLYMNRLQRVLGARQLEETVSRLQSSSVSLAGYSDITRAVVYTDEREYDQDHSFTRVENRYNFRENEDESVSFDYEKFIRTTSVLVFPAELRTKENMYLIGKIASVYGLGPDTMRVLVKNCVHLETMEFDGEKLKLLASRKNPDITSASDPYSLPPVSFLQSKQNGASVSLTDKKILERLSVDMHFPNEVINVMIEFILKISHNRLNSSFVDKVAGEWARDGISTKEEAVRETRKSVGSSAAGRRGVKPSDYITQQIEGTLPEGKKASQDLIDKVRKMQEDM